MPTLARKFLHYTIPSIVAMWVFSLYTMVDGFFVANFVGELEFSAINISMPFVNTLFSIAIIFAVGTSTIIGILLGEGNREKANKIFTNLIKVLVTFSLVISVVFRLFLPKIVTLLGATENTAPFVMEYLQIIVFFSVFFILSYNFEVLVKVDGFPVLATVAVVISALTNVGLDYLFIAKFHWGVGGAALATGLAQVLSALVFLHHFIFGKSKLQFIKSPWDFSFFKQAIPIGFGEFINEMSTGIIVLLFNNFLPDVLGETSLISYTVISYLTLLVCMTMAGLTQGVQPLISIYLGKKDHKSYYKLLRYAFIAIGILSVISFSLVNIFKVPITALFLENASPKILDLTYRGIQKYSFAYLLVGFNLLIGGFFAALGNYKGSITVSLSRGVIFIFLALQFAKHFLAPENIWFASTLSEVSCLIISGVLLYRETKNAYTLRR